MIFPNTIPIKPKAKCVCGGETVFLFNKSIVENRWNAVRQWKSENKMKNNLIFHVVIVLKIHKTIQPGKVTEVEKYCDGFAKRR